MKQNLDEDERQSLGGATSASGVRPSSARQEGKTDEEVLLARGYRIDHRLGDGGFGVVHKARRVTAAAAAAAGMPNVVAAKVIDLHGEAAADDAPMEVKILRQLHHDNIVAVYDYFHASGKDYLLLECVDDGQLGEKIAEQAGIAEPQAKVWMRQLVGAVAYVHDQQIAHLDIKPENILIDEQGAIKLADFGLALHVTEPLTTSAVGTEGYKAPEVLLADGDHPFDAFKADVWALGVVAFRMLTCRSPQVGVPYPRTFNTKPQAKAFIESALAVDPARRATAQQLAADAWLAH